MKDPLKKAARTALEAEAEAGAALAEVSEKLNAATQEEEAAVARRQELEHAAEEAFSRRKLAQADVISQLKDEVARLAEANAALRRLVDAEDHGEAYDLMSHAIKDLWEKFDHPSAVSRTDLRMYVRRRLKPAIHLLQKIDAGLLAEEV